jgi:hypothetical protein
MAIPFGCPHCGLQTLVEDEYAGESGPCASCGKQITVPYERAADGSAVAVQVYTRPAKTPVGTFVLLGFGGIAAAAMVIAIAMVVLFPAYQAARGIADQRGCKSNLDQIGMALRSYETKHGTLPPAFIPDENGKPMHSWRVLLLPFLDEQGLYDRYDFNEPWDGPNNSQLFIQIPDVYACPTDRDARPLGETSYMVVIGDKTLFPDSDPTSIAQVQDDPATTIIVVETPATGVQWMEPRDLKAGRMQFVINGGFGQEMGSHHEAGAHVLMVDGTVHFLGDDTPSDYIEGMTTISSGEPIPLEVIDD